MDEPSVEEIDIYTTASQQGSDSYVDVPDEAILYLVIDKKKQKLIDTSYLARQRKKTLKIWEYGINIIDSETNKRYWIRKLCMLFWNILYWY